MDFPKLCRTIIQIPPDSRPSFRQWHQSTATKFIKKWLRLPRNARQAILFHPEALNCPHLPTERLKVKVSQLATIYTSCDLKPLNEDGNLQVLCMYCMHAQKGASEAPRTRFRACKTSIFWGHAPDPPCTIYMLWAPLYVQNTQY